MSVQIAPLSVTFKGSMEVHFVRYMMHGLEGQLHMHEIYTYVYIHTYTYI